TESRTPSHPCHAGPACSVRRARIVRRMRVLPCRRCCERLPAPTGDVLMMLQRALTCATAFALAVSMTQFAVAQGGIDNSALESAQFRPHERTFGLVYTLPADVNATLLATVAGPLKEKLLTLGLETEALRANIPHITVVHIHNA